MKILLLYRRRWWLIYLPMLLAVCALLAVTLWVWKPLPPPRVVIGTGPGQSSYLTLARAYAARLEHLGIAVDIVTHDRPQEPLERLARGGAGLDVTFAQGLYAPQGGQVQALAVIGHEIVWLFAREGIHSLSQLRGQRIASAVAGSSNRLAAELLLRHAGIRPDEVSFTTDVGDAAISAISEGRVDAVVHVATGDSQTAATLARLDGVHLLGVERAGLLATREPRLRAVIMPQGSIELRSNLPGADLPTVVTLTHLLVRPDLHPALQRALLDVAGELHVMAGFLEGQGLYPSTVGSDFPVSPMAARHLRGGRPWLETLLPYGTAQWAELVLYALLPMGLLGAALLLRAPRYIDWRVDAALQHFYGELKFLEDDLANTAPGDPAVLRPFLRRLDHLEREVSAMELPDRYADRWYTLREHLQQARERLHVLKPA
ncbi:MAG: ABC transporter substrate-binding protein [Hydrogenophaga sp.]|uniref:ABC transporter substrate-binding protein n=1 Tax=Hydrogenophaga sp. TaxID=1904254 RepID=UPI0025C01985|nr:ABC transporter substrate-binding protein [Hydrogenophaga sp.]MBT9552723.1 ABC transporter substrate-binding protein [Hydrogenophaga sp.]